jgi:endonuclease YncB( thermonuclease family)
VGQLDLHLLIAERTGGTTSLDHRPTFSVSRGIPELDHAGLGIAEEPGGRDAAALMRRLVEGTLVVCELTGERTHGREVGVCRRDGRDIGTVVIEAGLARDCPRFSKGRYAELERPEAKSLPLPSYCEPR